MRICIVAEKMDLNAKNHLTKLSVVPKAEVEFTFSLNFLNVHAMLKNIVKTSSAGGVLQIPLNLKSNSCV